MSRSRDFEQSFAGKYLGGGYSWRMYGPQSTAIATAIVLPGLYLFGTWLANSGLMDVEHTFAEHADGPMADLYDALQATRDGASCGGDCGEVVSSLDRLDDATRAQAEGCLDPDGSIHVREKLGDFQKRIVVMRCGDGALWRAELRNAVSDEVLLGGGEVPSDWSIYALGPDVR